MSGNGLEPYFRNVFVLCTGRSGSQTFIRACEHFTNYTAGHETRTRELGPARFAYPTGHIEADNRLAWFLGRLEKEFGDDAFYVHLRRDPEKVAASYDKRWAHRFSLIDGYSRSLLMRSNSDEDSLVAMDLVHTITANIEAFLRNRPHKLEINLDRPREDFLRFVAKIGGEGDIESALGEFSIRHNISKDSGDNMLRTSQIQSENKQIRSEMKVLQKKVREGTRALAKARDERDSARRSYVEAKSGLKRLERRYNRLKFVALIAGMPLIVAFAPIWVPIMLARKLRRRAKSPREVLKTQVQTQPAGTVVYDAFYKRVNEGPCVALEMLTKHHASIPQGTADLFRAMDAESDDAWLESMRSWAQARGLPAPSLEAGEEPRFQRIVFPPLDPVESSELVTVIVPCYNAQNSVRKAIKSILDQSWRNLEVIAVNDASSDFTGRILDRMALEDPRLRVLHNAVNVGPYVSKNRALRLARGAYVTGHDADDIAFPNRIASQMAIVKGSVSASACISYMVRLTEQGAYALPVRLGRISFDGVARLCSISMLCKKEEMDEVFGHWDSVRFGADSELIIRIQNTLGERFVLHEAITMFCLSGDSNLSSDPETGIMAGGGLSPVRQQYKDNYLAWHASTPALRRFLPFPHEPRLFDAPEKMRVPVEDVQRVLADDCSEHDTEFHKSWVGRRTG